MCGQIEIVENDQNRMSFAREFTRRCQQVVLMGRVETGNRFIEQQDTAIFALPDLGQGPGKGHPLPLPAGKPGAVAQGDILEIHAAQHFAGDDAGFVATRSVGESSDLDRFEHGHTRWTCVFLTHDRAAARALSGGVFPDVAPLEHNAARIRFPKSGHNRKQ